MYRLLLCTLVCSWGNILLSQVERVYDKEGHILAINPINEDGLYDGIGYSFYPSGTVEKETPYKAGNIHGIERQFFENEQLKAEVSYQHGLQQGVETTFYDSGARKMQRNWLNGRLQGSMRVYYPDQSLQMLCMLHQDSIMYAQYFDPNGVLKRELMGDWQGKLDTAALMQVAVHYPDQSTHRSAGFPSASFRCQAYIPGVPTELITYSLEGGEIIERSALPFMLEIRPSSGSKPLVLYLQVSLRPGAGPVLARKVELSRN